MSRFNLDGTCKCNHIKEGTCKQISCCDCCEFYIHEETSYGLYPTQYIWGGEIRDKRATSMTARPYFNI